MSTDEYVPTEAELDSWMARAYEAEKRAWQAEHRITRLEAQTDIRGRAVVMYRERAREAEARIEAVRGLCDDADKRHASVLIVTKVRRALDT